MNDEDWMRVAAAAASRVRHSTSPNPWVGAAVVRTDGEGFVGATEPAGGRHAERVALDAALEAAGGVLGATLYTTLEPCSHRGRTEACTEAIVAAGVARVVVAISDPDPRVAGSGLARLQDAGVAVTTGIGRGEAVRRLRPYLHHRLTGRPWVVAKVAVSLDGRTAAPDGTSQWITGPEARADSHRLRAESDAIVVGARTVRVDDPALTVRDWVAPEGTPAARDPRRVVLGSAPADARVRPCTEWTGDVGPLLDHLGADGVVQVMVEGGPGVLGDLQRVGLVDEYVLYVAPALFGGDDARPMFAGPGARSITEVMRGEIVDVTRFGADIRITLDPRSPRHRAGTGTDR